MKIKYTPYIFIILTVILGFLGSSFLKNENSDNRSVINPKPVKSVKQIISEKKLTEKFDNVNLFDYKSSDVKNNGFDKYLKYCTLLKLKKNNLYSLINSKKENIEFQIPLSVKNNLVFELTQAKILSNDFKVNMITKEGVVPCEYKPGVYYQGIIKDKPNSVAAISIFENSLMGVISDETGNYNLGVLSDDKTGENYIYFNESDLSVKNKFKCGVDDFGKMRIKNNSHIINNKSDSPSSRLPVKVYFVADYQLYLDKGSNTSNVSDYITGFFNSVAAIYQNEFLQIQMNPISVYTSQDPYVYYNDSYLVLTAFSYNTKDNFNGDLAHLLSTRVPPPPYGPFGGISWINTLCTQFNPNDSSGRYSFSGIDNNYVNFPTYSWTVTVVAHEMGHSFGSMHTHACWWPITSSTIGQIDSCVSTFESCTNNTSTNYSGTLMSYCHLNGAIDLYLGFGQMPGDTVRLRYNQASCFGPTVNSSELPTKFQLDQNFPNPFNPSTTISFAVPQDAFITIKVYDVTGREIAELLSNKFYSRGYQNILFNSSQFNLSSGVYFYKLVASNSTSGNIYSQVKKMLLIK
jgi:hypothetical protein